MIHDLLPETIRNIIKNERLKISYLNLMNVHWFLYKKHIWINKNLDISKIRFAIAHEVWHYINWDTFNIPTFQEISENNADNFAITVLLPEDVLLEEYENHWWDLSILEKVFWVEEHIIEKRLKQIFSLK